MKEFQVAVVGSGFTGSQHVEAVRRIPGTRVVALADPNQEALREKAQALGIEHIFSDYREMLEAVKPDVIHNCTPNGFHFEINQYAIEHGVHVYCEKPLAATLEQCAQLAELSRQRQVACGVNFNYRNNAMVQEIRARVLSGETGRLFHVTGRYLQDWMMLDTDYNWRLSEQDGGKSRAIADIGSHWFDTAQYATGKKITEVYAKLFRVFETRKKPLARVETFQTAQDGGYEPVAIHSEDGAFILVRFEDGTPGQLVVSQVDAGHKNDLRLELAAQRCSLEWRQERADLLQIGTRDLGTTTLHASPGALHPEAARYAGLPAGHSTAWSDAFRNGIGEFYTALRNGSFHNPVQSYATFEDGYAIMKLVDACLESDRRDAWVKIK